MQFVRRIVAKCAIQLATLLFILSMQAGIASAATKAVAAPQIAAHSLAQSNDINANDAFLRQLQREGKLSHSVHVLRLAGPDHHRAVPTGTQWHQAGIPERQRAGNDCARRS